MLPLQKRPSSSCFFTVVHPPLFSVRDPVHEYLFVLTVRYRATRGSRRERRCPGGVHGAFGDGRGQGTLQTWGKLKDAPRGTSMNCS